MKTITFSMITLLTTVVMMLPNALAGESGSAPSIEVEKYRSEMCAKDPRVISNKITLVQCVQGFNITSGGADPLAGECKAAKDTLNKAKTEFNKACGQFNLKGASCEKKVHDCDEAMGEYTDVDEDDVKGKKVDKDKYESCPIFALKDSKTAKEKIKELKEDVESLEKEIAEEKEDVAKATAAIETAESERLEANQTREAKHIADLKEKGLSDEAKLKEAQEKIDSFDDKLRELNNELDNVNVDYSLELMKIEKICSDRAAKKVDEKMTELLTAVKENRSKASSLQAQITTSSEGRSTQFDDLRKREIARCRLDPMNWKTPVEILNKATENKLKRVNGIITQITQKKMQAYQELTQSIPQKNQKEAQELEQAFQRDMNNTKIKFDQKIGSCPGFNPMQSQGGKSVPKTTVSPNGCTGLQKELAEQMNQQSNKEEKRDEKQAMLDYYLELESVTSGFLSGSVSDNAIDLNSAAGEFESALYSAGTYCRDESDEKELQDFKDSYNRLKNGDENSDASNGIFAKPPPEVTPPPDPTPDNEPDAKSATSKKKSGK